MRLTRIMGAALLALALGALLAGPAAAKSKDRNGDRIPDRWERAHHLSLKVNQARRDQDRDGLRNRAEFQAKTNPHDADSDNDGTNDANEDADHDGVDNGNEQREHTNCGRKDTDRDGKADGREDADHDALNNRREDRVADDPIDRDTDNDGIKDGDEKAGTIESFDATTGILVIRELDGTLLSGKVTDETEIKCGSEDNVDEPNGDNNDGEHGDDNASASHHGGSGDDQGDDDGDHSGPGGGGEDNGNRGPNSGPGHGAQCDNACTVADLLPDTIVHEAELELSSSGPVWEEVELLK